MTRIVIIEDNETIRAELSVFLNRNGYETEAPERFDDVVSMAVAPATDLVLLDINLPVFDGFYVTREIRKQSQVPIIINHLHRYISFGSDNPQLCFKYTLNESADAGHRLEIYQKFVFNLNWSPEDFAENLTSVDELVESGELDLF